MAVTLVQTGITNFNTTGSISARTVSLSGVTSGDMLVLALSLNSVTNGTFASVSTTAGTTTTWTKVNGFSTGSNDVEWWYAVATSSGTITASATPANSGKFGLWMGELMNGELGISPAAPQAAQVTGAVSNVIGFLGMGATSGSWAAVASIVNLGVTETNGTGLGTFDAGPISVANQIAGLTYGPASSPIARVLSTWTTIGGGNWATAGIVVPMAVVPSTGQTQRRISPFTPRRFIGIQFAAPIIGPAFIAPPATIILDQPPRRTTLQLFRPHLPAPVLSSPTVTPPFPPPILITTIAVRTRIALPLRPHLPSPIVTPTPTFIAPPATIITDQPPRRTTPTLFRPHLAPPITPPTFHPPASTVVLQKRRSAPISPRPHLAPTNLSQPPLPLTERLSQALARILLGRTVPKPHLAPPNLTPPPSTAPVAPGTFIYQDIRRVFIGRTTPKPHLPTNNSQPPLVQKAYQKRATHTIRPVTLPIRPHLAAPIIAQPVTPITPPSATIHTQALARPYVGRTTPHAHLARPNLSPRPFAPAKVISTACFRPTQVRSIPRPHIAPYIKPIVTSPPVHTRPILISQALTQPRRFAPHPHTTLPIVGPFVPPISGTDISWTTFPNVFGWTAFPNTQGWTSFPNTI